MATPTATFLGTLGTALTEAEGKQLAGMSSDMRFLLSEFEVPERVQLRSVDLGYKNLAMFSVLGDDRQAVRGALVSDFGLDAAEAGLTGDQSVLVRLMSSQVLAAWVSASARAAEEAKQSADNRLLRLPNLMSRTALTALRLKFEETHGRVSDKIYPCASLLEKRMEEVEEGGITAPPLTEVISVDAADDEQIQMSDNGSNIRIRKAPKAILAPTSTEELRQRIRTLSIAYTVVGYKHSSRLWLKTATPNVWLDYVDYILSDQVALFTLDTDGCTIKADWKTVLEYDLAMRKLVCRKIIYDGMDFKAAIEFAVKDLQCRERYFVTPTAILNALGGKRVQRSIEAPRTPPGRTAAIEPGTPLKTTSKKKLKAADRIKALKEKKELRKKREHEEAAPAADPDKKPKIARTPDGRNICGFYQEVAGC